MKRSASAREQQACGLLRIIRRFPETTVVVLGDLVADEFVYGDIARISREAPVLILEHRRTVVAPGAAANAVANLRSLGANPLPVGLVGRDEAGQRLLDDLKSRGVNISSILVRAAHRTPCKSRLLAGGVHTRRQQIARIDRGLAHEPLDRRTQTRLDRTLAATLRKAGGLLVADYGYGVAAPERVHPLLDELRRRRAPVTIDSRARVADYRGATACTPNQEELERALLAEPLPDSAAVERAGRKLLRRTRNSAVLVTRGAKGMCLLRRGQRPVHIPAYGSDEVADVTGAGDTVISVFTLALQAGASFTEAAILSNYAAGLVVMKAGTATVSGEELLQAVREDADSDPGERR